MSNRADRDLLGDILEALRRAAGAVPTRSGAICGSAEQASPLGALASRRPTLSATTTGRLSSATASQPRLPMFSRKGRAFGPLS